MAPLKPFPRSTIVRSRCRGVLKSGKACKMSVKHDRAMRAYCKSHAHQQSKTFMEVKYCDGMTEDGRCCGIAMGEGRKLGPNEPAFCYIHLEQKDLVKTIICFGMDEDHQRCKERLRWEAPFDPFCTKHTFQRQAPDCPIKLLPDDVTSMILSKLEPPDRVAFALANKSCARLIRSWGAGGHSKSPSIVQVLVTRGSQSLAYDLRGVLSARGPSARLEDYQWSRYHICQVRTFEGTQRIIDYATTNLVWIDPKFSCDCFFAEPMTRHFDHFDPDWGWSSKKRIIDVIYPLCALVTRTMRRHPDLFSPKLERCMACKEQLTAADSIHSTKTHKTGAIAMRKYLTRIPEDANPETSLCEDCETRGARVSMTWCRECYGEPSATTIARAYWKTQQPAAVEVVEID